MEQNHRLMYFRDSFSYWVPRRDYILKENFYTDSIVLQPELYK